MVLLWNMTNLGEWENVVRLEVNSNQKKALLNGYKLINLTFILIKLQSTVLISRMYFQFRQRFIIYSLGLT